MFHQANGIAKHFSIQALLPGIALATGFFIPYIYELLRVGRIPPRERRMQLAAITVLIATGIFTLIRSLVASRMKHHSPAPELQSAEHATENTEPTGKRQFGLKHIFTLITGVAVIAAIGTPLFRHFRAMTTLAVVTVAIALAVFEFRYLRRNPPIRKTSFLTLVAAMFLPFTWIIWFNRPFGHVSGMLDGMMIGPGLIPAIFANRFLGLGRLGLGRDQLDIVATIVVSAEMSLGLFLIYRSSRAATRYLYGMFAFCSFSSFMMHLMYRA